MGRILGRKVGVGQGKVGSLLRRTLSRNARDLERTAILASRARGIHGNYANCRVSGGEAG